MPLKKILTLFTQYILTNNLIMVKIIIIQVLGVFVVVDFCFTARVNSYGHGTVS